MPLFITYPDWIKPEIIQGFPVRWYGLMYVIAFIITYALFRYQVKKSGLTIPKETISNFFFSGLAGMLVGARIFATLIYDRSGDYWIHPWLIFWPFDAHGFTGFAGMSFHGGLVGVILGFTIYSAVKKIDLLQWGDWLVAAFPLGYTFGRFGNFINSELWGRVSTAPWAILYPNGTQLDTKEAWVQDVMKQTGITATGDKVNLPRHPSQLYEAFGEGVLLWLILWFLLKGRAPFKGFLISAYLIGYGVIRFIIEYFRTPDEGLDFVIAFEPSTTTSHLHIPLLNFSMGQILCTLMIIGGVISLFFFSALDRKRKEREVASAKPGKRKK